MRIITVKEAEYLAFRLMQELSFSPEPIGEVYACSVSVLERCFAVFLQHSFRRGRVSSSAFISLAGNLFYSLVKNCPFQKVKSPGTQPSIPPQPGTGAGINTMISLSAVLVFLYKNKKWIRISHQELYDFAVWVTQSPPFFQEETIQAIEKFLRAYTVDIQS